MTYTLTTYLMHVDFVVMPLFFMSVSRIALVSPERSSQIERIILGMAQRGQLRGRVTEEALIDLLGQVR